MRPQVAATKRGESALRSPTLLSINTLRKYNKNFYIFLAFYFKRFLNLKQYSKNLKISKTFRDIKSVNFFLHFRKPKSTMA